MPRYYFDIDDGTGEFRDDEGTELGTDQRPGTRLASRAIAEIAAGRIPDDGPQKMSP
jgi:hypothetical protein